MKDTFGIIASDEKLIEYATGAFLTGNDRSLLLPKYFLDTLFTNYSHINSSYNTLPDHAFISIESGLNRDKQESFEIFEIEATLFEDLCSLFNLYFKTNDKPDDKPYNKQRDAILRSALISGFNLLESYLNGIAFDYYWKNQNTITDEIKEKLTEKKHDGTRKYLSLRDKMLFYPKTILSLQHPIFTESNCCEIDRILKIGKDYRDSIVHPSPFVYGLEETPEKVSKLYGLDGEILRTLTQDVITFIRKIDNVIYPDKSRISWIADIGSDGLFHDDVFK